MGLNSQGSIATLILQIAEDEQAYLYGDWRMIAELVDAFVDEHVEVVETEGSAYGAHGIRPLGITTR